MNNIIYKSKQEKIYYEIKNDEFLMYEISNIKGHNLLFKGKTEGGYLLDKKNTIKLFELLNEDDIKSMFGVEYGHLVFKEYLDKHKINYKCVGFTLD